MSRLVPDHFERPDAESVLSAIYTGDLPFGKLFELAKVLLTAAKDGDALARQAADYLADEAARFATAAIVRLGVQDEAVEVVLGGGIFDTDYTGFQARVAAGIHAVAPKAVLRNLDAPPVLGAVLLGLDAIGATEAAKATARAVLTT